ncbi:hypothetical protein BpHYR1_047241 [Brachionus plicatilis]|uniref:Uncharacterized protein n=1 Tax=Brachionus plicatilis TaxID=10195 RepID=A0A3M7QSB1_BRAPC|nr:hypothetical protein BpHYR1_047241 [Brachionus plicatilis]
MFAEPFLYTLFQKMLVTYRFNLKRTTLIKYTAFYKKLLTKNRPQELNRCSSWKIIKKIYI